MVLRSFLPIGLHFKNCFKLLWLGTLIGSGFDNPLDFSFRFFLLFIFEIEMAAHYRDIDIPLNYRLCKQQNERGKPRAQNSKSPVDRVNISEQT